MKLVKFIVEQRDPETGFWETKMPIKPDYKQDMVLEHRSFLFFTWVVTVPKVINEKAAKLDARKRAILQARSYWKHGNRPGVRISQWDLDRQGFDYVATIWEDGKFLDC